MLAALLSDQTLAQAATLVRAELKRDPNTLFLVGTYSIGKERVLEAVAKAARSRYVLRLPHMVEVFVLSRRCCV